MAMNDEIKIQLTGRLNFGGYSSSTIRCQTFLKIGNKLIPHAIGFGFHGAQTKSTDTAKNFHFGVNLKFGLLIGKFGQKYFALMLQTARQSSILTGASGFQICGMFQRFNERSNFEGCTDKRYLDFKARQIFCV